MLVNSRYLRRGAPTCCGFCRARFPMVADHDEAWRAANGECYCSDFCVDDAEQAAFCRRRAA